MFWPLKYLRSIRSRSKRGQRNDYEDHSLARPRPRAQVGSEGDRGGRDHRPDAAKEKPQEGEVIAVDSGKVEKGHGVPLDVKVGDRILFGRYTGNDIKVEDQEHLILREEEILAKVGGIAKAAGKR